MIIEVANIRLVSPARATQIESILLRLAQTGQLMGRMGEEQLIKLLEQVSAYALLRCTCGRRVALDVQAEEAHPV